MDDQIKDYELFNESQDSKTGVKMEPYLVQIYFKIIQSSLKKHSKRANTNNVSTYRLYIMHAQL